MRELVSRGHEVRYYSYLAYKERIESTGARFIACDEYDCKRKLKPEDGVRVGKDMAFSIRILTDTTLALDEMVCRDMKAFHSDCIVADSMAVWGKAALPNGKKKYLYICGNGQQFAAEILQKLYRSIWRQ